MTQSSLNIGKCLFIVTYKYITQPHNPFAMRSDFRLLSRNRARYIQFYVFSRWIEQIKGFIQWRRKKKQKEFKTPFRLLYLRIDSLETTWWNLAFFFVCTCLFCSLTFSHVCMNIIGANELNWNIRTSAQFWLFVFMSLTNFPLDYQKQRFCASFLMSFMLFVSFNVKMEICSNTYLKWNIEKNKRI